MLAKKIRLYQDVDFLSSIYPYRNYKNIGSLRKAADYIEKEFEKTGFTISRQEWEARGNIYQNIIASYQPEAKQRFIVGAHYDVYKDQPGADDNASAVAGLLEIARLLSEHQYNLPYGIDFVAFCLEEPPFFRTKKMGSYIHVKSLHEHDQEVIGMIALEMIGYFGEKTKKKPDQEETRVPLPADNNYLIVSGIRRFKSFNDEVARLLREHGFLNVRTISYVDDYPNNAPSDHRNYWKFDFPAVMILGTARGGNPHYHKITDTIDTLDFDVMTKAVTDCAYAIFNF